MSIKIVEITRPNLFKECDGCELVEKVVNMVRDESRFPRSRMKLMEVIKVRVDCREIPTQERVEMLVDNTYRFSLPDGKEDILVDGGSINYKPVVCPHFGFIARKW